MSGDVMSARVRLNETVSLPVRSLLLALRGQEEYETSVDGINRLMGEGVTEVTRRLITG